MTVTPQTDTPRSERLPRVGGRAPRIALLVYRDPDNDSRVLKSAETLREAGAEVLVVGLAPRSSGLAPGLDRTPQGLPLHRTRDLDLTAPAAPSGTSVASRARRAGHDLFMRGYRTARLVRYWTGAVQAARRFQVDVVHANDGNTLAPALALRLLTGSRIVYDSHELWTRRNARAGRWLAPGVEALIERWGVRGADAVITVSPSIADWLQRHYRLDRTPALVRNIPLWTGQPPTPGQGRLRSLAGLSSADRVVSYCGGIVTGRGLEETIEALAHLPEDVHLVMLGFGSPDYLRALRERAGRHGLRARVHVVPPVPGPEVPRTLADADVAVVFVRPIVLSYRYSLPNKLFESIHAGLPIVAADLPDTAALVRRYGVGEVFSSAEPEDLAAAIERVLADQQRYRAAARLAAPDLDWSREASRLIEAHTLAVRRCHA